MHERKDNSLHLPDKGNMTCSSLGSLTFLEYRTRPGLENTWWHYHFKIGVEFCYRDLGKANLVSGSFALSIGFVGESEGLGGLERT